CASRTGSGAQPRGIGDVSTRLGKEQMLDADVCEPLARHQQERLGVEDDGRPCGDRLVWEYPTDGPVGDCYGKLVACGPRWAPSIVDAEELDERHPDAHRCARLHDPAQIDG